MTALDIKSKLVERVEAVCGHLLPNGTKKGAEWHVGSLSGEAGHSLKVCLAGEKSGLWNDHAGNADDHGDIFALWMRCRGVDFVTALKQAKDWLGIPNEKESDFRPVAPRVKIYVRPKIDEVELLTSGGPVFDYLTKVRMLDPATLHTFKISQLTSAKHGPTIVFPVYDPAGKAVDLLKHLAVKRGQEGKKEIWSSADSKPRLFGWQTIRPNDREVVITEGEIDCLTVNGWGFPCLSLPQGAGNMEWLEHDFDALERFERVFLWTDEDSAGHKAAEAIATRLGRERCYRVSTGKYKDANEALCSGVFLGPDFEECVRQAKTLDPADLRNLGEMGEEIWEAFHPSDQRQAGTLLPFDMGRCRFGEVSIISGYSGHGKSHLLNQFLLHDAAQGENVCIASLEMPAGETGARISQMILGRALSAKERAMLAPAQELLARRFWVINRVGVMPWSKLLPLLMYAARRYGCTRFVIDSLLRCGLAEDDYNGQKEFVSALVAFAAAYGHVYLVCHARKSEDESKAPGKMDVRGAAAITDLVHNGLTAWRNKAKEQEMEESRATGSPPSPAAMSSPDAQISMWKNRRTGAEPFRKLWLHRQSGQFLERPDALPVNYIARAESEGRA